MIAKPWSKITSFLMLCVYSLVVFQFVSCSAMPEGSQIISFEPGVEEKLPKDIKKAFIQYWAARARLDWNVIYEMEAPHLKWKYTREGFMDSYGRAPRPVSVRVTGVNPLTDQVVDISITLVLPDKKTGRDEVLYPRDRWLRVNGKWYHIWKLSFLDSFL